MMMNAHVFENICRLKRQLFPNDRMVLFGSQARGDARPSSDWDLLLLLNKSKEQLRQDGDYDDWIDITEDDVMPLIEPVRKFIDKIERVIN